MSTTDQLKTTGTEPLRSYVALKQEAVRVTRPVQQFLKERGNPEGEKRAEELLRKLAEDRFNLVVLGQFKRGKSSLINAVVGKELLPTAIVPLTSMVTALRYGGEERAVIRREGFTFPQIVPVSQVADYVTERGNPKNEKRVLSAEIEVPVPFLRRGLYFIDTPGVGSIHEHNTATTYAFLPEADAGIFITSAEPPLTETELQFLATIRQHVRKIFFVLNKIDQLTPKEREEALAFTDATLKEHLGVPEVHLYPLSARMGLQAQLEEDAEALERSGLPRFQEALANFLAVERSQVFLVSILDRALRLLEDEEAMLALQERRQGVPEDEWAEQLQRFRTRVEALDRERDALFREAREAITQRAEERLRPPLEAFARGELAQLQTDLAARAAEQSHLTTEVLQRRVTGRLCEAIFRRFSAWLEEQTRVVGELAGQELAEREASLRRLQQQIQEAAAEAFENSLATEGTEDTERGLEDEENKQERLTSGGIRKTSPSGTSSVSSVSSVAKESEIGTPHALPPFPRLELPLAATEIALADTVWQALLPDGMLKRQMLRRLQEQLPRDLERVQQEALNRVRSAVETYCLVAAREWAQSARCRRERIEAVVAPQAGAPGPAGDGRTRFGPNLQAARERLRDLRSQIETFRDRLLGANVLAPEAPVEFPRPTPTAPPAPKAPAPPQGSRLVNAFQSRSCPLCTIALKEVWEFMASFQYQLATQEAAQQAYAAAHGFCHFHAWQLGDTGSPRGLSSGFPPLAEHTARDLRALAVQSPGELVEHIGALFPRREDCLACQVRRRTEEEYGRFLIRYLAQPENQKEYRRSQGVCLPHLQWLLAMEPPEEVAAFLVAESARHLEETAEEMHSYAVKFDTRHRDLFTKDEEDATRRVLVHLLGEQDYQ